MPGFDELDELIAAWCAEIDRVPLSPPLEAVLILAGAAAPTHRRREPQSDP